MRIAAYLGNKIEDMRDASGTVGSSSKGGKKDSELRNHRVVVGAIVTREAHEL
jgi:hypothetical protein